MTASFQLYEFFWATVADMPNDVKWAARRTRTGRMRAASRLLPRGRRNSRRSRTHVDTCMMMQQADGYDSRKFECCPPYHGEKGEVWEAFVRNFGAAMATSEVVEESLEDTLYGVDTGGDKWLAERHAGGLDNNGVWQQGHLIHPHGCNATHTRAPKRRAANLFG